MFGIPLSSRITVHNEPEPTTSHVSRNDQIQGDDFKHILDPKSNFSQSKFSDSGWVLFKHLFLFSVFAKIILLLFCTKAANLQLFWYVFYCKCVLIKVQSAISFAILPSWSGSCARNKQWSVRLCQPSHCSATAITQPNVLRCIIRFTLYSYANHTWQHVTQYS